MADKLLLETGDALLQENGSYILLDDAIQKFRVIKTMPKVSYYEYQASFSTNLPNATWTILAFGPGAKLSTSGNNSIKE